MKTVIVSDIHNRLAAITALFRRIGIIDENDVKQDGFYVIQVGDRLSMGYGEQEDFFYKTVDPWIDKQLLGNHEWPWVCNHREFCKYDGMENQDIVAEQMLRRDFRMGKWDIVTHVGDWLITHAGLHPTYMNVGKLAECSTAAEYAQAIEDMWVEFMQVSSYEARQHPYFELFSGKGHRRTTNYRLALPVGGILWSDIVDLTPEYEVENTHVPQICGHSSYCKTGLQAENLWCIDTHGGVAALVTEDEGKTFELFVEE